jgi:uncharacterized lipoprotein YmbA
MRYLTAAAIVLSAGLAAGCSSSPPSRFYTLSAEAKPATITSNLAIAVGPVSVPALVDRPEIVVSTGPNQVQLDEFNRWASPLQDNLTRAVAENLGAMLGTPRVTLFPQQMSTHEDYRVVIDVRRFESTPGKAAILDAVWTVRAGKDGKAQTGQSSVSEPVEANSYDALAAAHSRAVAQMSRHIADAIGALQASGSSNTDKTASPNAAMSQKAPQH